MIARAMLAAGMAPLPSDSQDTPDAAGEVVEGRVLVARRGDRVLGTSRLVGQWIYDLFVEPDCWSSGIGRQILAALEDHALQTGASGVGVFATPHAHGFYLRCGYIIRDAELMIHGRPAVQMYKRLRACALVKGSPCTGPDEHRNRRVLEDTGQATPAQVNQEKRGPRGGPQ